MSKQVFCNALLVFQVEGLYMVWSTAHGRAWRGGMCGKEQGVQEGAAEGCARQVGCSTWKLVGGWHADSTEATTLVLR